MTDRDPTCAGDLQGTYPCNAATDEASKLGEKGLSVQIFVVALNGDGSSTTCLQEIAAANASILGSAPQFFSATDPNGLSQQLDTIMTLAEAPLCGFYLGWGASYNNPDQLEVTVNGKPIAPYTSDGWSLSDYTLVLSGSSCAEVIAGEMVTVTTCSQ